MTDCARSRPRPDAADGGPQTGGQLGSRGRSRGHRTEHGGRADPVRRTPAEGDVYSGAVQLETRLSACGGGGGVLMGWEMGGEGLKTGGLLGADL